MENLALNFETIEKIKMEATKMIKEIILYGSFARGDYTDDSDIDIALLLKCSRMEAKKYDDALAEISTVFAIKYFAIVNFVSLPLCIIITKKETA